MEKRCNVWTDEDPSFCTEGEESGSCKRPPTPTEWECQESGKGSKLRLDLDTIRDFQVHTVTASSRSISVDPDVVFLGDDKSDTKENHTLVSVLDSDGEDGETALVSAIDIGVLETASEEDDPDEVCLEGYVRDSHHDVHALLDEESFRWFQLEQETAERRICEFVQDQRDKLSNHLSQMEECFVQQCQILEQTLRRRPVAKTRSVSILLSEKERTSLQSSESIVAVGRKSIRGVAFDLAEVDRPRDSSHRRNTPRSLNRITSIASRMSKYTGDRDMRKMERVRNAYGVAARTFLDDKRPSAIQRVSREVSITKEMLKGRMNRARFLNMDKLQEFVSSKAFQLGMCSVICLNALIIGVASHLSVRLAIENYDAGRPQQLNMEFETDGWLVVVDVVFNVIFLSELLLRLMAFEGQFCAGADWKWNMFDSVVVMLSVAETGILFIDFIGFSPSYMRLLGLARIARSFRVLRLMRFSSLVSKLRMLILAIVHCSSMLTWAVLVLLAVKFLFSVVFLDAVAQYVINAAEGDPNVPGMKEYFGSLWMSMLTLFMVVSGGVDWWEVLKLLLEVHVLYGLFFLSFVVITVLALLNVINSIFVNDAMETARMDIELRMKNEGDQTKFMVETLTNIFNQISHDGHTITQREFTDQVNSDDMKLFCALLDVHYPDGETLFKLLDVDGSGEVGIEEFVVGFMRLKGGAILIDNNFLLHETQLLVKQAMKENAQSIKGAMDAMRVLVAEVNRLHSKRRESRATA